MERNRKILLAAVAQLGGTCSNPSKLCSGAFKFCIQVRLGHRLYALKFGRDVLGQSGWYTANGYGTGTDDLHDEIASQEMRSVPRNLIVPYVAYGCVGGCFFALQPWTVHPRLMGDGEYARFEAHFYDVSTNNCGVWRGTTRVRDHGTHSGRQSNV